MSLAAHIVQLLGRHRLPLADEKRLQASISDVLAADGLFHRREVHLGPKDIVDFIVFDGNGERPLSDHGSGVAIEVKIKGGRRDIYRQLERYCLYDQVSAIVLATNVPMALPVDINGKPTSIAALGRGWL